MAAGTAAVATGATMFAAASRAAARAEGPVVNACLRLGRRATTCPLSEASVVTVTEEGFGRCFYYPYATRADADKHFTTLSLSILSRLMFAVNDGLLTEEIRAGGLHSLPYKTIRRAAKILNIYDKVFVQSSTVGFVSYHFASESDAYISYESDRCNAWYLDDGAELPQRKSFDRASYDPEARTFRGTVSWAPTSFCGDQLWEYEMVFDETFSSIVGGQVRHFTPHVSDKDAREQMLQYEAVSTGRGSLCYWRHRAPSELLATAPSRVAAETDVSLPPSDAFLSARAQAHTPPQASATASCTN